MKGFGILLLYFFTWRSVIVGSALAGLALLAFATSLAAMAPNGAVATSMLAFVLLLVVPYISAPKALRAIIGNRRLAIVPGLPLRTGLAMLLLTVLTAAFLPLTGWLLGAPEAIFWLGPQIFVIASLYTLVTQLLVTSRYMWVHIQWLPIGLVMLLTLFGEQLWRLATNHNAILGLATLAFAGWLNMLVLLARRSNFKQANLTDMRTADRETITFLSSWFSRKPEQGAAPTTSLLLGYPASLRSRAVNIVFLIVFNPLLSVLLMEFMAHNNGGGNMPLDPTSLFLAVSLFTSFATGATAWAETGPRARLLWLRVPGTRAQVWETLERELWNYFVVLFAVIAVIVAVIALYGASSMLLLHYVLTIFTLTLFQRYLPLAARLNGWSSLTQALMLVASLAAIGFTILYSLRVANFNLAFLLEFCLLLMGVLFRACAKFGFNRVDWQSLRHTLSKRAEAMSA